MAKQYITGFPTTQAEMADWQKKYKFDPQAKKWYIPSATPDITAPLGSAERTKQLTEKTNALLKQSTTPNFNTLPPADTKAVDKAQTNALSTNQTVADLIAQEQAKQEAERKRLEESMVQAGAEKGASIWETFLNLGKKRPESQMAEELAKQQEKYQIPQWLKDLQEQNVKVATIQGDITKLDAERQAEIDRANAQVASQTYINGTVNAINRKYNSLRAYKVADLAANAALAEAYQGNLNAARSLANDAVNAYVYDYQQKVKDFDTVYSIYGDWISGLDANDRKILDEKRQEAQREYEEAKNEKTNLMNLILQYPKAGISLDDSLEEATKKASEWEASQPEAGTETTPKLLSPTDIANLKQLYPGLDIHYGMTNADVAELVNTAMTPRDFTDEEIRTYVRSLMEQKLTREEIAQRIQNNRLLSNKDRANLILSELMPEKKKKSLKEAIFGTGKKTGTTVVSKTVGQPIFWKGELEKGRAKKEQITEQGKLLNKKIYDYLGKIDKAVAEFNFDFLRK